jgi:2-oxoglutarate dehydrogenase E2 component (dihydrolipoamide succinyltransferase)
MSSKITVPELGESIIQATVGRWMKQLGETVVVGDPLVELETEKVTMEIAATTAGILETIVKPEGETVGIGEVLGTISSEGQTAPQTKRTAQATSASAKAESAGRPVTTTVPEGPAPTAPESSTAMAGAPASPALNATPIARRMAAEHGIDVRQVAGSGSRGQVTQEDVAVYLQHLEPPEAAELSQVELPRVEPPTSTDRREEHVRLSTRRQTIARRLVESQRNAAMLTTFNEVDMSAVMELRRRYRDRFKEQYGIGLGFMSFFTRAAIGALKSYPRLNASIQGDEMILKHYYDIGIAIGVDEGLVVPVLRDADRMSFAEIERHIAALSARAHDNTLTLADLRGGTFTITNGGTFGSLLSTPILNAPQVGILGMHKIEERPIAALGQVVVHPMMYVALSYDHRIVDGSEAVRFLVRVKELIEEPSAMLLEL